MNRKRLVVGMPAPIKPSKHRFRFCIIPATLCYCYGVLSLAISAMLLLRALELGSGEFRICLGKSFVVTFHGVVCLLSAAVSMRRGVLLAIFAVLMSTFFSFMAFSYAM